MSEALVTTEKIIKPNARGRLKTPSKYDFCQMVACLEKVASRRRINRLPEPHLFTQRRSLSYKEDMNYRRKLFLITSLTLVVFAAGLYIALLYRPQPNNMNGLPTAMKKVPGIALPPEGNLSQPMPRPQVPVLPAAGGSVSDQYTLQGQLASIHYPDGSVYSYQYDIHGNKISETTGGGRTWKYSYDDEGHPTKIIDPEGRMTEH